MPRLMLFALAAFLAFGTPASAQTVGATAVTVLKTVCGPYLNGGIAFGDAAIRGGFTHDASVD
jgi:hypothetical protein